MSIHEGIPMGTTDQGLDLVQLLQAGSCLFCKALVSFITFSLTSLITKYIEMTTMNDSFLLYDIKKEYRKQTSSYLFKQVTLL